MAKGQEIRDLLKSHMKEGSKSFFIYNVNDDISEHYEAYINAKNGEPCLKTEYKYDVATRVILASQESISVWNELWDFDNVVGI